MMKGRNEEEDSDGDDDTGSHLLNVTQYGAVCGVW